MHIAIMQSHCHDSAKKKKERTVLKVVMSASESLHSGTPCAHSHSMLAGNRKSSQTSISAQQVARLTSASRERKAEHNMEIQSQR